MAIDKIECDVGPNNFCYGYHWFWNAPYLILTSKKFNLKMHSLSSVVDTELGPNCIRDWNKSRRKYIKVGILLWILQDLSCWCFIIPWQDYGGRAWPLRSEVAASVERVVNTSTDGTPIKQPHDVVGRRTGGVRVRCRRKLCEGWGAEDRHEGGRAGARVESWNTDVTGRGLRFSVVLSVSSLLY